MRFFGTANYIFFGDVHLICNQRENAIILHIERRLFLTWANEIDEISRMQISAPDQR